MDLKPGDAVLRLIGEEVRMPLTVSAVDAQHVHCGSWTFRRDTGGEVDPALGWDGITVTGSRIVMEDRS